MKDKIAANGPNPTGKTVVVRFTYEGGLGNQMFEFAHGLAVARKLDMDLEWSYQPNNLRKFGLTHFGLNNTEFWCPPIVYQSRRHGKPTDFDEACAAVLRSQQQYCGIHGLFQINPQHTFGWMKEEIKRLFYFERVNLPGEGTPVALQVRRGDYLRIPVVNVCKPAYFQRAMEQMASMVDNPVFHVVSDDLDWCRNHFADHKNVIVPEKQSTIDGLRTMVSCKAHIMSNSTYGFWGCYLGESGPVIVPNKWYHPNQQNYQVDYCPSNWLRINV